MLEQMDKQENKSDQSTSQSGAWRENLFKENSKGDANPAATHVYPDATLPHITLLDHNAASKDLLDTRTETSPASLLRALALLFERDVQC